MALKGGTMEDGDSVDDLIVEAHELFDEIYTAEAVSLRPDEIVALIKEHYDKPDPKDVERYLAIIDEMRFSP